MELRRRALSTIFMALLVSLSLSGCFKEWTFEEVKDWYEPTGETFDECMKLGHEKLAEGKSDKAIQHYRSAMSMVEAEYGPNDLRIATAADEIAHLQEQKGMFGSAEETYRKALEVRSRSLPPRHNDVIRTKKALAAVLRKNYKAEEAQQLLNETKGKSAARSGDKGKRSPRRKRATRKSH